MAQEAAESVDRVFVGRVEETQRLQAGADQVRAGGSWLSVLEGEAGIGKSTLIRRFAASLNDFTLLRASGDPLEIDLPYGVLNQLTQRLPSGEAAAGTSPHVVGGHLLLHLGELQATGRPVALIVDDLQWADRLSLQALGFVLRRLWADRVLIVLVTRPDPGSDDELLDRMLRSSDRTSRIELRGLAGGEVARLAQALVEGSLAPGLSERLFSYTHGHPLYVRTVLAEVPAEVLRDGVLERWPVPRSLRVGIRGQLDRIPAGSRELLEALAVLDARTPLATVGRLAGVEDAARALGPALNAGLAVWSPNEPDAPVVLAHALQRDAIYEAITPERRRSLHAGAADLVGTATAWAHRVAATAGTDEQLAAELELSAQEEAAAGRSAVAATRLRWAASLSVGREDRERRFLTSCAQSLLTLRPGAVLQLRPQVEDCAPGPLRSCVLGVMDLMGGAFPSAEAHLNEVWSRSDGDWVTVLAGTFLAQIMIWNGRGAETVEIARRTLAIGDLDPATTDLTRAVLVTGVLWDAGPRAALAELTHLPTASAEVANHNLDTLATRGVMRLFQGDLTGARTDLATVTRRDQQGAGSKLGPVTLSLQSVVHYLTGDWDESESAAERALAVAAIQDQLGADAAARFAAVCVEAGRGEWERARARLDDLARLAQALGSATEIVYSALGAATVAQAEADFAGMLRALGPLIREGGGLRYQPFWWWQQSLLIEALTGTGQLDAAALALGELQREHDGFLDVVIARLSGQLAEAQGQPQDALRTYEQALAGEVDIPLLRARLEHAHGKLLLATGAASRREAADWLTKARTRFAALRAAPFLSRCEEDLVAGGFPLAEHNSQPSLPSLTERELSVAHLIAAGRTNQQAAAELFVSQKTVEYHLARIYPKLGIASRRQLAAALRTGDPRL